MSTLRTTLRRAILVVALLGATGALHRSGTGPLATPTLSDFMSDTGRSPADLAMASVRLVTLGAALLAVTLVVAELVAEAVPGVGRLLHRVVPATARQFARAGLGLRASAAPAVLFASVAPSMLVPPTHLPPQEVVTLDAAVPAPRTGTAQMRPTRTHGASPSVATPAETSSTPDKPAASPTPATTPDPRSNAPDPVEALGTTWTVAPGESFWSIADEITSMALGRQATSTEIDPVWRALVDANRARLIDPDDLDLLLTGQTLDLGGLPLAVHTSIQISG